MACSDMKAIVDWLVDGARSAPDTDDVLAELCNRLLGCGIPLWRVGLFVLTLHPQIMGQRFLWMPGTDVDVDSAPYKAFEADDFRNSPVRRVIDTGFSVRRRLAYEDCPIDFAVTRDLLQQGATDYLAVPLFFADGTVHGATFATQWPGGFSDAQIGGLESVIAPLARVVENRRLQRTARILLDTYVGNHAGAHILAGEITRGHTAMIDAAIWLSDMRDFTHLADHLPLQTLVDLLNRYFDCQVPAILKHGGEVLKFMGDGLLAIFAVASRSDNEQQVCNAALAAALEARTAITASFPPTEDLSNTRGRFGLALHVGEVFYGNVGSGDRLDFTCIGPAVNLAARIEKLTGELGRTILASGEFAQHFASGLVPVGEFAVRGFGAEHLVFGLEDEGRA